MFNNITIFTILLLTFLSTSNAQLITKKEFRLKNSKPDINELYKPITLSSKPSITRNSNPVLAGFLSLVVPGAALGQLYNGQYVNFGIRLGISVLVIGGFALSGGLPYSDGKGNDALIPLAILYVANWISSIVDAVIYNKKHFSGK